MAERRMFAKTIIDSDAFVDMPATTQLLYFHLAMRADDDGFINNPKSIMRNIKCSDDDLKILFAKKFLIPFESGVVVIKHWKIHNYIRKDTYSETKYKEEKSCLLLDENSAYKLPVTDSSQLRDGYVTGTSTQDRLGKERVSIGNIEVSKDTSPLTDGEEEILIALPLNNNAMFPIPVSKAEEWKTLYPAVDVEQALRSMKGWLDTNPTKRKTKSGILRFVNSWLSREQDRGGTRTKYEAPQKSTNIFAEMLEEEIEQNRNTFNA